MVEMTCKKCDFIKPETDFPLNRTNGREYRKTTCNSCDNKARLGRKITPPIKTDKFRKRVNAASRKWNQNPKNRPTQIVQDARYSDEKKGLVSDLDKEWVAEQIANPCSYCGEKEILMTLDRIDNSIGHLKNNLLPACGRCNYFRRDMPFDAWKILVPAVKEAREKGLLEGWDGFGRKRKSGEVPEPGLSGLS